MTSKKHSKKQTNSSNLENSHGNELSQSSNTNNSENRITILNLLLTVVAVIAAVVSTYFGWQGYQKSLPKETLEDWSVVDHATDNTQQLTYIAVIATLSNIGGTPASLVKVNGRLTFQPLPSPMPPSSPTPLASITSHSTPTSNSGTSTPSAYDYAKATVEARINALGVVEPAISIQGSTRLIVEIPGIASSETVSATVGKTGLLEFTDLPSRKTFCIGGDCFALGDTPQRDVYTYVRSNAKTPPSLDKGTRENVEDDLPITLGPGESKTLVIAWNILPSSKSARVVDMSLVLQFNDGTLLNIPVLEKLK